MGNIFLKNYKIYGLIIESLSQTIKYILIIIWNSTKYKRIMYPFKNTLIQYNLMINETFNGKKFKIIK